jgi:hypothetical protein
MKHSFHNDVTRTLWPLCRLIRLVALPLAGVIFATAARPATGLYFGQTPPGKTPTLFAPGIVSLPNIGEIRIVFSPNGDECFFGASSLNSQYPYRLYYTRCVSNVWTPPALAPFHPAQGDFTGQPFFSADGNTLHFTSNADGTSHLWIVRRTSGGWDSPQILPYPINTNNANSAYYSETLDGTGYFISGRSGGRGGFDVWRTRQPAGQPLTVENLGSVINTSDYEFDACVDPNGRFLLFARSAPYAVFLSYSTGNGGWSTPVNMDTIIPGFNTGGGSAPSFSPDGRYLFWVRGSMAQRDFYWVLNPFYPQLAISNSGANVNLSWSTNLPGFVLESTDQLGGTWTSVPSVTGYSATLPVIPETNQFFRLKK